MLVLVSIFRPEKVLINWVLNEFLSDQDYEMNNDEEYDVDVDESGTYLPDNRRYRRSVPRTMWTLEKVCFYLIQLRPVSCRRLVYVDLRKSVFILPGTHG